MLSTDVGDDKNEFEIGLLPPQDKSNSPCSFSSKKLGNLLIIQAGEKARKHIYGA